MSETAPASAPHISDPVFDRWVLNVWRPGGNWARLALLTAVAICFMVFQVASNLFHIPPLPYFDGSLLRNPSAVVAVFVVAIFVWFCTLIGTVVAGAIRFEAGLFAAALGLMAISLRSGTVRSVIFDANGSASVYYTLAAELVVLAIILAIAWFMLIRLGRVASAAVISLDADGESTAPPAHSDITHGLFATAAQIVGTGIVLALLAQSDAKNQGLASMFIAAFLGAIAAYLAFPNRNPLFYWIGPLALGVFGYVIAAAGGIGGIPTGNLEGLFAGLARPLPLDYASTGVAGALLGFWMTRGWNAQEK